MMSIKRQGFITLCLLMLCVLFDTGIVSFAYAAIDALTSQFKMEAEIKWLDRRTDVTISSISTNHRTFFCSKFSNAK
jgi:hypothetical protein